MNTPLATTATTPTTSANAKPASPKLADDIANMKAAMLNLELTTLRYSKDPNAKYKLGDILERADDSLTRTKLNEHHGTANKGQTLEAMINGFEGLDDHARKNAHSLISDKRDAVTDKLAAMDPKTRADLEDKAAAWADQVMDITQAADRDDSEHSDKIASILGPRSTEEIEVIRSRMRLQTSGVKESQRTTLHEQLDRAFTGNDKDIALAGLSGNHAHVAARQLVDAASDNDPERVHRIVKELSPEKLGELRQTNPVLLAQVASNMPADQRAQIDAALGGRRGEAEGGRIESMLQPVDISASDAHDIDKAKRKMAQKEAQDPERLIAEFERMSPADLAEARKTHGDSWDELIAERYKDADSTVRLRIEAAARGDKVGERALRLRQGMRTFDQGLIDQVLANLDLQSPDPKKKAAAEAERRDIEARMRGYDATDQQTQALIEGKQPSGGFTGRSTQQQLDSYYERAKHHDTEASGLFEQVEHVANKDERMARTREKAHVDKFAATEMWTEGDAHASTKVRRAELAGSAEQKAAVLENLDSENKEGSAKTLAAQAAEYSDKFGGRDMLAGPDLSGAESIVKLVPGLADGDRSTQEIAAALVRDNMNDGELRMQHVRETGVIADRTRSERVDQMKERRNNSHSGWLEGSERLGHMRGGNRGSEDRLESSIALMERGNAEGVDDREQARRDKSAIGALASQRDEKQREAAKIAQVLSIASKIAAILTANPALFVAVDAGFSALRIAAQEMIANEAYEMTADLKHMAVDAIVNLATAKFASLGKGAQAGTQAAKSAQMAQRVGNVAGAMGGAAAHSAIDGEDGGGAVFRAALGAILPGYFRGKAENAVKGTSKAAGWLRSGTGALVDTGANMALAGHADGTTAIDLVGNTVAGRNQGTHATRKTRKSSEREHARTRQDLVNETTSSVDLPRPRIPTGDEVTRSSGPSEPDRRYTDIETHAQSRVPPQVHLETHAHFAEDAWGSEHARAPSVGEGPRSQAPRATSAAASDTSGSDTAVTTRSAEPASKPTSVREEIDRTTGVDKGPEHEQWRRDMAEMYANQEIEAQNVTRVHGQTVEAKKDGYNYVGNTDYDVRRFAYDNADLTSITLDAHLRQGPGVTPEQVDAVKRSAFKGVDQIMNDRGDGKRHTLPDGSKLQVEPTFHDNAGAADHVADVVPPALDERGVPIGSNQERWVLPEVLNPVGAAHELVGHGLGFPDSYVDQNTWFRDTPTSPFVTHDGSFMETVAPGANLKQRHLDQLGRDISKAEQAKGPAAESEPPSNADPAAMPKVTDDATSREVANSVPNVATTASGSVIPSTAPPRAEGTLGEKRLRDTVVNELALATPAGSKALDQNTIRVPAGDRHVNVALEVGTVDGGQSAIHQQEDGSYRLVVSDAVADRDATRAIAHGTVAVQRQADPDTSGTKRPPAEVEGRAAELRVVLSQVDQRGVRRDGRTDTSRGDDVTSLLGSLGVDSSPEGRARLREALAFDPALLRRAELHLDGYEPRQDLDAGSDLQGFGAQRRDRLAHLDQHVHGQHAESLRQVEDLSLGAQLRSEEGHRIFDGANVKTNDLEVKTHLMERRQSILDSMNDPHLSPEDRRAHLAAKIDALGADPALQGIRDKLDLEGMHKAAAAYDSTGNDHGAMALDPSTGLLRMPGADPSAPPTTLRDMLRNVDAANQAAAENGLGVNYVLVVHQPSKDPGGSELSHVEIIARKQPQTRHVSTDAPKVPGNAGKGDLVVDHGVGRGGFAVESATVPDGGMIVQTDHISKAHAGQMSRDNAGITDAGPLTKPGSVMMFADLLMHPELLKGAAHEPNAGIRQSFINNVSAKYEGDDYKRFAEQLSKHMPEGATVELQWTMSPEREGGIEGDRGHIEGDRVANALGEHGQRAFSMKKEDVIASEYTIDAATRSSADPDSVGKYVPPIPTNRRVITFGPNGEPVLGAEEAQGDE